MKAGKEASSQPPDKHGSQDPQRTDSAANSPSSNDQVKKTVLEQPIASPTPQTVIEEAPAVSPVAQPNQPRVRVSAVVEIWRDERLISQVPIDSPDTYIGRVPGNQILLKDDALSRHHARISKEGTRYVLYDQSSTNGTYLHNERTNVWDAVRRAPLRDGSHIRIGRTVLRFRLIQTVGK